MTAEELSELLAWPNVCDELRPDFGMRALRVLSERKSLASIDFIFDGSGSFLHTFGFGNWHFHPHEVDEAIEIAWRLLRHENCVVEDWSNPRKMSGCRLINRDDIPNRLPRDAQYLIRHFFGLEPVREKIDFGRYFRGRHSYVELMHKATEEATFLSLGMPTPEW